MGYFLKIRYDIDQLFEAQRIQYETLLEMHKRLVTTNHMKEYLENIDDEMGKLHELRDKYGKDKWKNFRTAFGGKEPSEDS